MRAVSAPPSFLVCSSIILKIAGNVLKLPLAVWNILVDLIPISFKAPIAEFVGAAKLVIIFRRPVPALSASKPWLLNSPKAAEVCSILKPALLAESPTYSMPLPKLWKSVAVMSAE